MNHRVLYQGARARVRAALVEVLTDLVPSPPAPRPPLEVLLAERYTVGSVTQTVAFFAYGTWHGRAATLEILMGTTGPVRHFPERFRVRRFSSPADTRLAALEWMYPLWQEKFTEAYEIAKAAGLYKPVTQVQHARVFFGCHRGSGGMSEDAAPRWWLIRPDGFGLPIRGAVADDESATTEELLEALRSERNTGLWGGEVSVERTEKKP